MISDRLLDNVWHDLQVELATHGMTSVRSGAVRDTAWATIGGSLPDGSYRELTLHHYRARPSLTAVLLTHLTMGLGGGSLSTGSTTVTLGPYPEADALELSERVRRWLSRLDTPAAIAASLTSSRDEPPPSQTDDDEIDRLRAILDRPRDPNRDYRAAEVAVGLYLADHREPDLLRAPRLAGLLATVLARLAE